MPINRDPPFAGTPEVPAVQVTMEKVDLRDKPNLISQNVTDNVSNFSIWSFPLSGHNANTPYATYANNADVLKNVNISIDSPVLYLISQTYQAGSSDGYIKYINKTGKGIGCLIPAYAVFNSTSEVEIPLSNFSIIKSFGIRNIDYNVKISDLNLLVESSNISNSLVYFQLTGIPNLPILDLNYISKAPYSTVQNVPKVCDNNLETFEDFYAWYQGTEVEILRGNFSSPVNLIEIALKAKGKVSGGTGYLAVYLSKDNGSSWTKVLESSFTSTNWTLLENGNLRYFKSDFCSDKFTNFRITLRNASNYTANYARIYEISVWDYTQAKAPMTVTGTLPDDAFDKDFGTGTEVSTTSTSYVEVARIDLGTDYYNVDEYFEEYINPNGYAGYMCYKFGARATSGQTSYIRLQYSTDGVNWRDYEEYSTNSTTEVIWTRFKNCNWRYLRILQRTSGGTGWAKVYEFMVIA